MGFPDVLNIVLVVFGIGLVIFVHEAGHYMAARWCGARVEVFSLGFGPRLFGWKRGDTLFQVAAVPLGGFVKVAGEYLEGRRDEPEPGSLESLSVPQRFLYYSGGVIMNVVFALVVLPLVMFAGLPALEPVIGPPTPGMPAWEAGVPAGSRIVRVNGTEIVDFEHLVTAVALNGKKTASLDVLAPGATETTKFELVPEFDENVGFYRLGLVSGFAADRSLVVQPESPAAAAGLTGEDLLLAVEGQPGALPVERQLQRAFEAGEPIGLRVRNAAGSERRVEVAPTTVELGVKRVGVGAVGNRVAALRTTGAAAALLSDLDLRIDDHVIEIAGTPVWSRTNARDALLTLAVGASVEMAVRRDGERVELRAESPPGIAPIALLADVALGLDSDTARVTVVDGSPAERAGVQDGDQVVSVGGASVDRWDSLLEAIRREVAMGRAVEMEIWRDVGGEGPLEELEVSLVAESATAPSYGFALSAATTVLRAESVGGAIAAGFGATKRFLTDVWLQLRKMLFSSEISTKNLGGIISISVISSDAASQGLSKLFFFLAILSINLAIINLLPIPILDGGHLLFLLIEGLKGSPVSERTFGYSQVVGLVMIMSLMVYVTYQDIVRWFIDKP